MTKEIYTALVLLKNDGIMNSVLLEPSEKNLSLNGWPSDWGLEYPLFLIYWILSSTMLESN